MAKKMLYRITVYLDGTSSMDSAYDTRWIARIIHGEISSLIEKRVMEILKENTREKKADE